MFQVRAETVGGALASTALSQMAVGEGGGLGGGVGFVAQPAATSAAGPTLITVIQEATAPAEWVSRDGTGGTITEYDGLLIVRHQPRVHHKIEELLEQIRSVRSKKAATAENAQSTPERVLSLQNSDDSLSPLSTTFGSATNADSVPAAQRFSVVAAVLDLNGEDPKSVMQGTRVWLTKDQTAQVQSVVGQGPRQGTLLVRISGDPDILRKLQEFYQGLASIRLTKPPTTDSSAQ